MSLQRRLLLYLLICAPLVWIVALVVSVRATRHEVDELFDTELIRLTRQVQVTLRREADPPAAPELGPPGDTGESDVRDLAIAVWDRDGRRLLADREGVLLPRRTEAVGFVDMPLEDGEVWRVYYLQSHDGAWLVAAGQKVHERDELIYDVSLSHIVPWLLMLPVLLVAMTWAVRRAFVPVHALTQALQDRDARDLRPVEAQRAPLELQPMVQAINGLLGRVGSALDRERRFTADAAHELRTPLAVLRAQWDVLRRARDEPERERAQRQLTAGLERLDRLVNQLLSLSRVEARGAAPGQGQEIAWPALVEQVVNDCLPLAERRGVELAVESPATGHPLPLLGDAAMLGVMLRNLLDNALRYAPRGSLVMLRLGTDRLEIENDGEPIPPERAARLGERFLRPDGQEETGSGLGVSIAQNVAAQHGLVLRYGPRDDGRGTRVVVAHAALGPPRPAVPA